MVRIPRIYFLHHVSIFLFCFREEKQNEQLVQINSDSEDHTACEKIKTQEEIAR